MSQYIIAASRVHGLRAAVTNVECARSTSRFAQVLAHSYPSWRGGPEGLLGLFTAASEVLMCLGTLGGLAALIACSTNVCGRDILAQVYTCGAVTDDRLTLAMIAINRIILLCFFTMTPPWWPRWAQFYGAWLVIRDAIFIALAIGQQEAIPREPRRNKSERGMGKRAWHSNHGMLEWLRRRRVSLTKVGASDVCVNGLSARLPDSKNGMNAHDYHSTKLSKPPVDLMSVKLKYVDEFTSEVTVNEVIDDNKVPIEAPGFNWVVYTVVELSNANANEIRRGLGTAAVEFMRGMDFKTAVPKMMAGCTEKNGLSKMLCWIAGAPP